MPTKERKELLNKLYKGFRSNEDVNELLRDILKEDLLVIFKMRHKENRDTILGSHESLKVEQVQAVLNRAKELGISFEEIASRIIFVLSFDSKEEKQKCISLIGCIKNPDFKFLPEVLHAINESYGLKSLWEVISEDDRERIKTKLNEDEHKHKHKDVLDEINRIEGIIRTESEEVQIDNTADDNLSETSSLASDESTINSKSNSATVPQSDPIKPTCKATLDMGNGSESRKDAAKKGMKFGAICGVIAALAVGGGLFAAGAQLPILALIGIAVAAAVLTGLIASGITYVISSKIENPDTSRSATEQGLPQLN